MFQTKIVYEKLFTDEKFLKRLENLDGKIRSQTQIDSETLEVGDQVEYYSEREKKWRLTTYCGKTPDGKYIMGTPRLKTKSRHQIRKFLNPEKYIFPANDYKILDTDGINQILLVEQEELDRE